MTGRFKDTLRDSAPMRWFILVLISVLMFATYWFQDFFSGLKPLMESQLGITPSQFGTLLGLTTIANVLGMVIVGGMILDKWGIRLTAFVFGSVATIGGVLVALGANDVFSSDPGTRLRIMIAGRIIFGVGLETTCVLVTRTIVKWFKGYELALAMAINMGIGRLGSALGTALSPDIANFDAPRAVTFAASLIAFGFIMYIIYLIFDVRLDKQVKAADEEAGVVKEEEEFQFSDLGKLLTNKAFLLIAFLCVAFYSAVFPFMQYAPDLLVNKFDFSYTLPATARQISLFGSDILGNLSIYMGLFFFGVCFPLVPSNLKEKSHKIASIVLMGILFFLFIWTFKDVLGAWLQNGPKAAALIPMGTIMFTPIFGKLVDSKGKAASLMIIGSVLLIFAHITLSVLNSRTLGYMGLFSLGIAFSLVPAAMWPSVAKIVAEHRLGTAYATMFTIQNWGLGAFFWGIGKVADVTNPEVVERMQAIREGLIAEGLSNVEIGKKMNELRIAGELPIYNYTIPILMLVGLGIISIFLAFMLLKESREKDIGLEKPSNG